MSGSGRLVDGVVSANASANVGRRKRKNYYITYALDGVGGLETHLTTGTVCMLSTVIDGVCEGRQGVTRGHAARLLCAYRRSPALHRVVKVRGVDWVR
jgi:hypothetical protein